MILSKDVTEIIAVNLELLREDVIRRQRAANQWATGRTAAGYSVAADGLSGSLMGYPYVSTLVSGRRPGKAPKEFTQIIMRWMQAKGIQPRDGESLQRAASAIAWSIRRNGSRLYRDGAHTDLFDTAVADFTERLTRDIGALWAADIAQNV